MGLHQSSLKTCCSLKRLMTELSTANALVTLITQYPGIGVIGSTPLGSAIFPTSDNTGQKSVHILCINDTVQRPSGNRTASFSKEIIFGAGEAANNSRTMTKYLILIIRLSYNIRAIISLFTRHHMIIGKE